MARRFAGRILAWWLAALPLAAAFAGEEAPALVPVAKDGVIVEYQNVTREKTLTETRTIHTLADGRVTYTSISRPGEPYEIRAIAVRRDAPALHLDVQLAKDTLPGVDGLPRLIEDFEKDGRRYVVAAVNGDFYQMANRPRPGLTNNLTVTKGRLAMARTSGSAFAIAEDGMLLAGRYAFTATLTAGDRAIALDGVNCPPAENKVFLYTDDWGWPVETAGFRLRLDGLPLRSMGEWRGEVVGAIAPEDKVPQGEVAVVGLDGPLAGEVVLRCAVEGFETPLVAAVGGGQVLLRDGAPPFADDFSDPRHPRTMAGFNNDTIFLVTVDGRQEGWSKGMRSVDQAALMKELGALDAVNLDGGGSTTIWVGGEVVNRPSDKSIRRIANGILVTVPRIKNRKRPAAGNMDFFETTEKTAAP